MSVFRLLLVLIFTVGPVSAKVSVHTGPFRFQESTTTTTTTETIVGPKGTRTIRGTDSQSVQESPGTVTKDSESDVTVEGVEDTGLRVERKVYVPGQAAPIIVQPEVTGGPGTIHRKSSSKTTTTPRIDVQAR